MGHKTYMMIGTHQIHWASMPEQSSLPKDMLLKMPNDI